jgi:hypothetical protein
MLKVPCHPVEKVYTAHCTGINVYRILKESMGAKLEYFATGCKPLRPTITQTAGCNWSKRHVRVPWNPCSAKSHIAQMRLSRSDAEKGNRQPMFHILHRPARLVFLTAALLVFFTDLFWVFQNMVNLRKNQPDQAAIGTSALIQELQVHNIPAEYVQGGVMMLARLQRWIACFGIL